MKTDAVYHETIPFLVARVATILMGGLSIMFLVFLLLQVLDTPIGDNPPPNWMYLILSLVFIATTWLVYNLKTLTISIDQDSVTVSYGRISYTIALANIEAATVDTNLGILYGGWGIRMASIKGESALIYNVISRPRVVLKLRNGRFKQFAFSTRQPDEVIRLVHPQS